MSETASAYRLPGALVGHADLARLIREVEAVDSYLEAQRVRSAGHVKVAYRIPSMSRGLSDFLEVNKLELTDDKTRSDLRDSLRALKDHAPAIHLTFATEPDLMSLQQLTDWIRKELHPQALINVGVQPSLVGGVYVRTPNHVHDYSLRSLLQGKRDVILNELEGLAHAG